MAYVWNGKQTKILKNSAFCTQLLKWTILETFYKLFVIKLNINIDRFKYGDSKKLFR